MAWKTDDFTCTACSHVFEELYDSRDIDTLCCPECQSSALKKLLSAPNLAMFSIASPERKKHILKKRSEEHTTKQVAKEPERWGAAGIERAKGKISGK
jgi:putative FmdB family regulatory protein